MRTFRHFTPLPEETRGAVVAMGNFDGIHRGHQAVIRKAGRLAREFDTSHAVLTFEPHPRSLFNPNEPPFRLTPFRIKARLIEALGVDSLFVLRFDRSFASLSAEEFVKEVLADGLAARFIVTGEDFRFGKGRQGDIRMLDRLGRQHGFGASGVAKLAGPNQEIYSSTGVRDYLKAGNPTRAAYLLGRYWEIEGRVLRGDQRGRSIGFPTANIRLRDSQEPARGVYAVRAGLERNGEVEWHAGVANLGVRPTVDGKSLLLEVHLFDYSGDIYGRHLRVALVDFLRPEMKFESLEALRTQIAEDSKRARVILAAEEWDQLWPASPFMAAVHDPSQ